VVALPGETIEIRAGNVYVNGRELDRTVRNRGAIWHGSNYPARRIAPGEYFVMGDHRIAQTTRRVFGSVPRPYIYGKAVFAYWPVDHFGSLTSSSTVSAASR